MDNPNAESAVRDHARYVCSLAKAGEERRTRKPPLLAASVSRKSLISPDPSFEEFGTQATQLTGGARDLAEHIDAPLRVIAADSGKPIDLDALAHVSDAQQVQAPPVDSLVAAAEQADLVVLGSRGLHGLDSLGSVSERVAHRVRCSVSSSETPTPRTDDAANDQ